VGNHWQARQGSLTGANVHLKQRNQQQAQAAAQLERISANKTGNIASP